MSRYLLVTHQTALTPEVQDQVRQLLEADTGAEFAILVPALPASNFNWEGEMVDVAAQRAEAAKELLQAMGASVVRTAVGTEDPLEAIKRDLDEHGACDGLVICTLPPGLSRWLRLDLVHQAQHRFHLPVTHVVAHPLTVPH
jgi:hypothetical protein